MVFEIVKKELKRVFTDKRLIFSTFILPAVSIYIIYMLMGNMIGTMVQDIEAHEARIYVHNAPASFQAFYQSNKDAYHVDVTFGGFEREAVTPQIQEKNLDLLIEFPDDFDTIVTAYETQATLPEIMSFFNPAEDYSSMARNTFIYQILGDYERQILHERFSNPNATMAFAVDATNTEMSVVPDDQVGASFLSMMLPMLIGIMLFAGAMGIGMDTIAGEKERGTMATLLMTPVKRESIALGKILGLGIISILSSFAYFIAIILSLPNLASFMGSGDTGVSIGSFGFEPINFIQLFVLMITLVGVYVGLITLISVRAKTTKEAGTYMTPIYMVVMVAAFSTMFSRAGNVPLTRFMIPVYGSITAFNELFAFELGMDAFLLASGVNLLVTAIIVYLVTRAFNNERVMLNA